jgi:hypothetical protein
MLKSQYIRRGSRWVVAALALGFAVGSEPANAETIVFTQEFGPETPNWMASAFVPRFDTSLGDLEAVVVSLTGHIEGFAGFESLDRTGTKVEMSFSAEVTLAHESFPSRVVAAPNTTTSDDVTGYDGLLDFGGSSGRTYEEIVAQTTDTIRLVAGEDDLSDYLGIGTIPMRLQADGTSRGDGSGNLVLYIDQQASARLDVTYEFTPVPEPGALALLSVGAFCALGRRRDSSVIGGDPSRVEN